MTNEDMWEREAGMTALLAVMLRGEPSGEWLRSLAADEVFSELPYAGDDEDAEKGRALVESWLTGYGDEALTAARADFMALLEGPGKPLAPPWESVCLNADEALLFQKETLEVRSAYRELGLQVERLHHDPDDHIAYELEFISAASARTAAALREGDELRAGEIDALKVAFLREHLSLWAFTWADMVLEHAKTDLYRGVALLVKGCLRELCKANGVPC